MDHTHPLAQGRHDPVDVLLQDLHSRALPPWQLWQAYCWDMHTRCRHRADLAYGITANRGEKTLTFAALKTKLGFVLIHGAEQPHSCSRSPGAGLWLCSPSAPFQGLSSLPSPAPLADVEPQ